MSTGNLWKKLSHPVVEIRERALTTLLQKLDLGFLTVAELSTKVELGKALLQWFNFPPTGMRSQALNLLFRLSKEDQGCETLASIGAIDFLTELRMDIDASSSQTVDLILQNIIMKVPQCRGSSACLYLPHETDPNLGKEATLSSSDGVFVSGVKDASPQRCSAISSLVDGSIDDPAPILVSFSILPPAKRISPVDEELLRSSFALFKSDNNDGMMDALNIVNDVLLKDFPIEYLLRESCDIFGALNSLTGSPRRDLAVMERILGVVEELAKCLMVRVDDLVEMEARTYDLIAERNEYNVVKETRTNYNASLAAAILIEFASHCLANSLRPREDDFCSTALLSKDDSEDLSLLRIARDLFHILEKAATVLRTAVPLELTREELAFVGSRCLTPLADAVLRLSWVSDITTTTPPSASRLWSFVHVGFFFTSLLNLFVKPVETDLAVSPDELPLSCVNALCLLARDPFFNDSFANVRSTMMLPLLSRSSPIEFRNVVHALDVCAKLENTHHRLKDSDADDETVDFVLYLAYTHRVKVLPCLLDIFSSSFSRHRLDFLGLLAHPITSVRTAMYEALSQVVAEALNARVAAENPSFDPAEKLKLLDDEDVLREIIVGGMTDSITSVAAETILTLIVDRRDLYESQFLNDLIRDKLISLLPFAIGISSSRHLFSRTMVSLLDFRHCSVVSALKSTIALLFSKNKTLRNEGIRRFLSVTEIGKSFLRIATVVELETFADAFVQLGDFDIAAARSETFGGDKDSLGRVKTIFLNTAAAPDVRATAAAAICQAIISGGPVSDSLITDDAILASVLADVAAVDNAAAPPLSIDDVIPNALRLFALTMSRKSMRMRLRDGARWPTKTSKSQSAWELVETLCRLAVKYRENSSVVASISVVLACYAFSDLENDSQAETSSIDLWPKYPVQLSFVFHLPFEARFVAKSIYRRLDLEDVNRRLDEDGTVTLVKHSWNVLSSISEEVGPLSYTEAEKLIAQKMDVDKFISALLRRLKDASCHEDVALTVTFLALPRLRYSGAIERAGEDLERFFRAVPCSEADEILAISILESLSLRLQDVDEIPWVTTAISSTTFCQFVCNSLKSRVSPRFLRCLLEFIIFTPSFDLLLGVVNWLGSGLDTNDSSLIPLLTATTEFAAQTIVKRFFDFEPERAEALKRLCLYLRNILCRATNSQESKDSRSGLFFAGSCLRALSVAACWLNHHLQEEEAHEFWTEIIFDDDSHWRWILILFSGQTTILEKMSFFLRQILSFRPSASVLLHKSPDFVPIVLHLALDDWEVDETVVVENLKSLMLMMPLLTGGSIRSLMDGSLFSQSFERSFQLLTTRRLRKTLDIYRYKCHLFYFIYEEKLLTLDQSDKKIFLGCLLRTFVDESLFRSALTELPKLYDSIVNCLNCLLSSTEDDELKNFLGELINSGFLEKSFSLFHPSMLDTLDSLLTFLSKLIVVLSRSQMFGVYVVAVDLLKSRDSMCHFFVANLAKLDRGRQTQFFSFWATLLTCMGKDNRCLEVLDSLLDLPYGSETEEAFGAEMLKVTYAYYIPTLLDHPLKANPLQTFSGHLLKTLVAVSSTAKSAAIDFGLVESLIHNSNRLLDALVVDSLNGAHSTDGSVPDSDCVKCQLLSNSRILQNLFIECAEAKNVGQSSEMSAMLQSLWSWRSIDSGLNEAFFGILGAFASDNPAGIARCIVNNRSTLVGASLCSNDSNRVSFPPTTSLAQSLLTYASRLKELDSNSADHRLCFVVLGKMASVSPEFRGVIKKTNFVSHFARLTSKKATSRFRVNSSWLDFICNLTLDPEGQAMVLQQTACVDSLFEFFSLPESTPASRSLRQKAALVIHNLSFSSKNATLLTLPRRLLPIAVAAATRLELDPVARKTSLIFCAVLWTLATGSHKNAVLVKGTDFRERARETLYKMRRTSGDEEEEEDFDVVRHEEYLRKILSVLDS